MSVNARLSIASAFGLALAAIPAVSLAQAQLSGPPPSNFSVDERGVDLVRGTFVLGATDVVIGQPGAGGLSYSRDYVGQGWRDNLTGTIEAISGGYFVSIGGVSEIFTLTGGVFVPTRNVGATLVPDGVGGHIFTTSDGVIYTFAPPGGDYDSPTTADQGRLSSIAYPNGETVTYAYKGVVVATGNPNDPYVPARRVQAITNNFGYQIKLGYQNDAPGTVANLPAFYNITSATGFNMAVDYCDPSAVSCTYSRTWPSATYNVSGATQTVTNQLSNVTTYTFTSNSIASITAPCVNPGSCPSAPDVSVSYSSGLVSSVASATGTWGYSYSDIGTTRTTTVTDPLSNHWTAVSNLTTGLLTSWTNPLSQTISYQYDGQGRPDRITMPEGNRTDYHYDARGNVDLTTATPKSGTSGTITTSAIYPTTCSYAVTCNKPESTTDERGNVTDYVWDTVHGGIKSVTLPSPDGTAPRPQTRYGYSAVTPYYKDATLSIVAGPAVTLLTTVSACATGDAPSTGPTCVNTAAETRQTITYGPTFGSSSTANNLLPTVMVTAAGNSSVSTTTNMTYDANGDLFETTDPLGAVTRSRYDVGRRLVGVVGPDPDGGSSLLHRAQRMAYNARSQITLTEAGTTPGYSDTDWTNFATLQRQQSVYDGFGRPYLSLTQAADTTSYAAQQVSYDGLGRAECAAVRMNPSAYSSLIGSTNACSQTALGSYGPDRIVQTGFDVASRPISSTSGVGSSPTIVENVTYTANGKPQSLTDGHPSSGSGNVSIMEYDGYDRLEKLRYPNATGGGTSTTDYQSYAYDAASNVTGFRDRANQNFAFGYDALNRQYLIYAPSGTASQSYTFDNLNRMLTAANGSQTVTNTYDALSRLTNEATTTGSVTLNVASHYNAAGERIGLTWPDSYQADYVFDAYGAVTQVKNGSTTLAAYSYDNLGRRTLLSRSNGVASAYGYDPISRLNVMVHDLAGSSADVNFYYAHNPAGQILQRTVTNNSYLATPSVATTGYANNGLNQLTTVNGGSVGYDAAGNLTSGLSSTYGFDAYNRMTTGNGQPYSYDPLSRLYQEASANRFIYDGAQLIAEIDTGGTMQGRYVPGAGLDDVPMMYSGSGATIPLWLLADERQSVIALTDSSANLNYINRYDEYGVPQSNAGRLQYTGQMWLPNAGAYHYRARAYAPQLGRFLQTDPLGYAAGANLYSYVAGDPINLTDPSGLDPIIGLCPERRTWTTDITGVDGGGGTQTTSQTVYVRCVTGDDGEPPTDLGEIAVTALLSDPIDLTCRRARSRLGKFADFLDDAGQFSGDVALVSGIGSLVPTPASPALGVVAVWAGGISLALSGTSAVLNWIDGRHGNAAASAANMVWGSGVGRMSGAIVRRGTRSVAVRARVGEGMLTHLADAMVTCG